MTDDLRDVMRGMIIDARARFWVRARVIIKQHPKVSHLGKHAEALASAIGEVSPEEAIEALQRFIIVVERRRGTVGVFRLSLDKQVTI